MNNKEKNEVSVWTDPIVAEVRKCREALFEKSGYNLRELSRILREEQALSGRQVLSREKQT